MVALLSSATVVYAKPVDATKAEARRHYDAGLAHFNLREYPQAIDEFQAAYRILPDPVFLYNLGQSHRLSDNPEQALYFYQTYLRMAPDAANRTEVEDRIAALEKLITEKHNTARPPDHALPPSDTRPASAQPTSPTAAVPDTRAMQSAQPASPPHTDRNPVYRRWWFWTITAVVVVGAAVGIGVGVGVQKPASFNANVGTFGPNALTVRF